MSQKRLSVRLLISSLEPSANLHLKEVLGQLRGLLKSGEGLEICGIFDPVLGDKNAPIYSSEEFSAMGFVEVLPLIFKAKRAIKEMAKIAQKCDAALLIDSPAFNLPLAKALKMGGFRGQITYYILPQVWAWKPHRVAVVERWCDNLASILPFDAGFYNRATFVGHPLLDELDFGDSDSAKTGENAAQKSESAVKIGENAAKMDAAKTGAAKTIAFLPGSRKSEIARLMPVFKETAKKLDLSPPVSQKLLVIPPHLKDKIPHTYGDISGFTPVFNTPNALKMSDFAFICSGTATLEAALLATPFVLCYRAKKIDIWLAKRLVKLKHIGLANIMLDFMNEPPLNDELIGDEASSDNLIAAYKKCDFTHFSEVSQKLRHYLAHGSAKSVAEMLLKTR